MQNLAGANRPDPGYAGQRPVEAVRRHVSKPVARLVDDEVRGYAEKECRRRGGVDRREHRVVRRQQRRKGVPLSGDMPEILRAAGPKILAIEDAVVPKMAVADETQPRQPSMHGHLMGEVFEQVRVDKPRKAPEADIADILRGWQAQNINVQEEGRGPRRGGRGYDFAQRQVQSIRPHFVLIIRLCRTAGEGKFSGERGWQRAGLGGNHIVLAATGFLRKGPGQPVSMCTRTFRFENRRP